MDGMFLHVLSDTLGSVGVIISAFMIRYYGWTWSDPLCSIFIAVMTVAGAWPLLKSSGEILLQRVPRSFDANLARVYDTVKALSYL
jgi:solute carrier family 30 (zinc transporter), member 5/7